MASAARRAAAEASQEPAEAPLTPPATAEPQPSPQTIRQRRYRERLDSGKAVVPVEITNVITAMLTRPR